VLEQKQVDGTDQCIATPCRVTTTGHWPPPNPAVLHQKAFRGRTLMACICCALHTVQARRSTIFLVVFACRTGTARMAGQGAAYVRSAGWLAATCATLAPRELPPYTAVTCWLRHGCTVSSLPLAAQLLPPAGNVWAADPPALQ
jgi:hypothetical protein